MIACILAGVFEHVNIDYFYVFPLRRNVFHLIPFSFKFVINYEVHLVRSNRNCQTVRVFLRLCADGTSLGCRFHEVLEVRLDSIVKMAGGVLDKHMLKIVHFCSFGSAGLCGLI
ncbi:hypothetical protein L596_022009 [Steinernema carpocapsae]|nr:hypothetical protein L596_022009 [Steinernema carpocapsae]